MYEWVPQICPICEVPPGKYLGRRGGEAHRQKLGVECEIWRCEKCSLIFPNPMPIPLHGLDQHYAVPTDDYFQHHPVAEKRVYSTALVQQLVDMKGSTGTMLDIGAGQGEVLRAAVAKNWRAIGIETSSTFAVHAAKNSGAEIRREPLEECGFADASFDAVVLSAVLEHLYNPNQVIEEISRILRPNGVLFIDVPNEQGLYFRVGNFYQKLRLRNWVVNLAPTFEPFHVFGFSPKSLRALLAKHNLKPQVWQVFAGEAFVPARGGVVGLLEKQAANVVTAMSKYGDFGAYIRTWAVKDSQG